ncbi:hypothetical protein BZA05DRAFT_410562 [Tricharina praecox]|uniref:uncharacterized protein n=1 Tax=Tricharina praecox TaxID=43433 RepID=UPI00221E7585|nr:uncharacterized protein BZA05DRAFT_410562 [Tricharina praecox]KAI5843756.1 hypothetical protein BZA05DRAFT_410562 [Tricharina praecox]
MPMLCHAMRTDRPSTVQRPQQSRLVWWGYGGRYGVMELTMGLGLVIENAVMVVWCLCVCVYVCVCVWQRKV